MIFSEKDFGFWHDRLGRISFFMALESGKQKLFDRAMQELEQAIMHFEGYQNFNAISHTSLLVNKVKVDLSNIAKSTDETLGYTYLRYLNNNDAVFASIKDTPRYLNIKERLSNL
jgi:hypothetical protein